MSDRTPEPTGRWNGASVDTWCRKIGARRFEMIRDQLRVSSGFSVWPGGGRPFALPKVPVGETVQPA